MSQRWIPRLREWDNRVFRWCNGKIRHSALDRLFGWFTHLGGASFTISFVLVFVLFAPEPWRDVGWKSLVSLAVSHVLAAIIKRKVDRRRPYMALHGVVTGPKPLKDPSFPSGHTTAAFSVFIPFALASAWLSLLVIPLAATVGMSRMYLGLHYPSDCFAGCFIGTSVSVLAVSLI
ncbi:phosphatase PAP2 family protein [Paenibacillus mesophilus]|uniref:phosphatase PAP2 family protein n=1 Tax=Paenibacillus mesophilus TaxID=2582849 RepID=UPI00110EE88D|nr:phosphatase PAP2 family protein [Paenibacillus mesophilus]TMV45462.1 phosphatase PAP2 family protein [Paenibacillus mesophilus]